MLRRIIQPVSTLSKLRDRIHLNAEQILRIVSTPCDIFPVELLQILFPARRLAIRHKSGVCHPLSGFQQAQDRALLIYQIPVGRWVQHIPLFLRPVVDLRDNVTIKIEGRIGQEAHPPCVDSQCQADLLQNFGLIQAVDALFRFIQTVIQKRQGIAVHMAVVPRAVRQLRREVFQHPNCPLQVRAFSCNFLKGILFQEVGILRAVHAIFHRRALSRLKAPIVPQDSTVNIVKDFCLFKIHCSSPLSFLDRRTNGRKCSFSPLFSDPIVFYNTTVFLLMQCKMPGHAGVPTQPGGFLFHHSGLLKAAYISAVSAPEHGS